MASCFEGVRSLDVAVIGASQGIGFGFVRHLLADDRVRSIEATYRNPESAKPLLELSQSHPTHLRCSLVDVTDESQVEAWANRLHQDVGTLHLVANCVGILQEGAIEPEKSLRQIDPDRLLRYFQVNSIGGILLAKHLLPLFRHGDRSVFASISAKIGSIGDNYLGGWYGYRASKAALNMFLRTAAIEYSRKSPRTLVVMLHPGTTDTRLSRPFQRNVPPEKLFSIDRTVTQLLGVIEGLTDDDSGQFFSWDGSRLPW
ncbi:SDR family NAD(P)-dependent oxidoreductase [Baaleninema simplex]|uniref:SDR family NAD(P)-dependent oxidoreductase n=1 Tax=Baaleninema simplex TaxID=2862350 RepID=UPI00036F91C7|nr:SDR family NAD(P)-dependent oxidoreductase [Baaleninema simplex]